MAEIITVSVLNRYVKTLLERDAVLDGLAVRGEIAGFVHHYKSGHYYFSLRDEQCSIKAVMFSRDARRLPFTPQNGMRVILRGRVSLFERDGAYQLYVEEMIPDGVGSMQLALEQLKARLAAEGLFDPARKKPIPTEPACIGLVTSATGAAIQDIRNVLTRRWPLVQVLLAPVNVQGQQAAGEISAAIRRLDADGRPDVILVARGGGSREDLWVFNDEGIARAAAGCKTPLVSAIGHEIDYCILDRVADLRAPTPSAAAELCVPDQGQIMHKIQLFQENIHKSMQKRMEMWYNSNERLCQALAARSPGKMLEDRAGQLDRMAESLRRAAHSRLAQEQQRMEGAAALCAGLNPYAVLARGYAMVRDEAGELLPAEQPVQPGEHILVQRARQTLRCQVEDTLEPERNPQ